jgi:hypothetical protein
VSMSGHALDLNEGEGGRHVPPACAPTWRAASAL